MPERFRSTKGQRGFTLAEILVTTAIFAIIMIAALTVYDRSNRVFSSSTAAANLQQSTRIGFDKLVSDLRMTGFDYNRGGIPTTPGQYPQPDEQIEYAGPTAVVIRANFDYNTNSARSNGLAPDGTPCTAVPPSPLCGTPNYYALSSSGGKLFPYITTDNTEIVAYVLRSTAPGAANSDSISFYADTDVPRRAYPNVAGQSSGGHAENQVTISGIDISNNNPPYTLYRVTVDDLLASPPRVGTPVAENIRSLQFQYYQDGVGSKLLEFPGSPTGTPITATRNAGGTTVATSGTGAIGGDGQYDPNAVNGVGAGNFNDRTLRSQIQSVRVSVVGMDANPTANYQNPTETNPSFKTYKEYSLSSLIVPRNLGLQGFPEPSYNPPGAPTITGACVGHCAAPFIAWTPPSAGGPVTVGYEIQWDSNQAGSFSAPNTMPINDPSATSAIVKDCGCDPSQPIYYRIVAINDNGQSQPSALYTITPQNTTKPAAPTISNISTNLNNQIALQWVSPSTNASTLMQCSGVGANASGSAIPAQEIIHFQVARSTDPNFTPNASNYVLDFGTASQPAVPAVGATINWVDAAAATGAPVQSLSPPAACIQYYYRVRALDRCYVTNGMNYSGVADDSTSAWTPAVGSPGWPGRAASSSTPSTPVGMSLDPDATKTHCPNGLSSLCDIALTWNKVTTDTGNNPIAVDTYTLFRERRIQGNTTWTPDATLGSGGQLDISGFTSQAGSLISYVDHPAYQDPLAGVYEYRYSVAAKICNTPSPAFSNTTTYPGCNFGVAITAQGNSAGSGTQADPWVLGYGDSITVAYTSGNQLASVSFQVMQNGNNIGSATTISSAPFVFGWSDQPGGSPYEVWIRMTDVLGCTMTYVRYVTQQPAAQCTFQDLGTGAGRTNGPPAPILGTGSQPRPVTFDFAYNAALNKNFTALNNQPSVATTETMKFNTTANPFGTFNGSMTLTWADINGLHRELTLVSVDWYKVSTAGIYSTALSVPVNQALIFTTATGPSVTAGQAFVDVTSTTAFGSTGATGTFYIDSEAMNYTVASATRFTVTRGVRGTSAAIHTPDPTTGTIDVEKLMTKVVQAPSAFPDVAAGEAIRFVLNFTYDSSHKNSKLTTSGSVILGMCIKYKVASDPTLTQSCNLVGQAATSANPTSCD
jgi:prepilin-type N-terminal cleavage/methylation domain-containing protein